MRLDETHLLVGQVKLKTITTMKQLVFKTVDGVELYVDTTTGQYETDDWDAIETALKTDINNAEVDPFAAQMASNLLHDINTYKRLADMVC